MLPPDLIWGHHSIKALLQFKPVTMVWLFIIIGIVVVIGPILYLLPTRKDKELMELRTAARAAGLVVELASLHKVDSEAYEKVSAGGQIRQPRVQCARYGLPMDSPLPRLPEVHLVKGRLTDWRADPEYPAVANEGLVSVLQPHLDLLPGSARGLTVTASLVWVYWLESLDGAVSGRDRVDEIKRGLAVIRDQAVDWHSRGLS